MRRQDITVGVSICTICDKDRDPLDVPSTSCGHAYKHARLVAVAVAPTAERDALAARVEALEASITEALARLEEPSTDPMPWARNMGARRILEQACARS